MEYTKGRYSWVIRPVLIILDLFVLNVLALYFFNFNTERLYFFPTDLLNNKHILYIGYSFFFWLISTAFLNFYKVYRYTSLLNIIGLIVKQFLVYVFIFYAFIGVFRSLNIQAFTTFKYLVCSFLVIGLFKLLSYYLLKYYRNYFHGNVRRVVIIGKSQSAKELHQLFSINKNLGYQIKASFGNKDFINNKGSLEDSFAYVESTKSIDEVYCSIDDFSEVELNRLVKLAEINHCNIKFLQDQKEQFTKRLKTDFYNYLPVLSIQEVSVNNDVNKMIKRVFDIVFSIIVIAFIMSWLTPIIFILIKLESKGPLFYKHKRNGINYKEFTCFKFRSLKQNQEKKGTYITEEDNRVTKIGKFLRRTSLDEMPQFYNVLKGDMSVVGPRPHMLSYTDDYSKKVDKYNFMFRHNVKPGITGLAQVKGYRGEIKIKEDIINRIKYDNFYIENWSLILDFKIIFQTVGNFFKGQKEAY
jgi:putative colanic acid biosynthesis UDP-glucose lipid carrier transferase